MQAPVIFSMTGVIHPKLANEILVRARRDWDAKKMCSHVLGCRDHLQVSWVVPTSFGAWTDVIHMEPIGARFHIELVPLISGHREQPDRI